MPVVYSLKALLCGVLEVDEKEDKRQMINLDPINELLLHLKVYKRYLNKKTLQYRKELRIQSF
jgi:hypothetical protein